MAEGMGFEPMVSYKPTLDFESSALNQLSHPSFIGSLAATRHSYSHQQAMSKPENKKKEPTDEG
jgi:hypothetical protein